MLRLYRDLTVKYYLISLSGAMIVLCVFTLMNWDSILAATVLALAWIFACAVHLNVQAAKRINASVSLLTDQCDARAYLNAFGDLCRRNRNKKREAFLKSGLAAGYLHAGDARRTLEILTGFAPQFSRDPAGASAEFAYYNDLTAACLGLHDTVSAEQALAKAKASLENPKQTRAVRESGAGYCRTKAVEIAMEKGNYEQAEEVFLAALDRAKNRLQKVFCSWELAKILHHAGRDEEARPYLDFVRENGGDTVYVKEAEKIAARIGCPQ